MKTSVDEKYFFFQNPILVLREVVKANPWLKMARYYNTEHIHPFSFDQVRHRCQLWVVSPHVLFRLLRPFSRDTQTLLPVMFCLRIRSTGRLSTGQLSTLGGFSPRPTKSLSGGRDGCRDSGGRSLYSRRATWTPRTGPSPPTPGMSVCPTSCPPQRRWCTKPVPRTPTTRWP